MGAEENARQFIEHETEFHLGFLTTEQRHPMTMEFSAAVRRDTVGGLKQLLAVDQDLLTRARELNGHPSLGLLTASIERAATTPCRICFSGCGSTGRLSILLESMWRRFWHRAALDFPSKRDEYSAREDSAYSIMTGGDRALIKSVESFEDFQRFGRQQVIDAGLGNGDLLIAISEGGETSSVIGTAWEALHRGCEVYFVYNNPTDTLADRIRRCREIVRNDSVVNVDLTTGPMALSGSTRMQATSMELFVVGSSLEQTCCRIITRENPDAQHPKYRVKEFGEYTEDLATVLEGLNDPRFLEGLGSLADTEASLYRRNRLITYLSDVYLLDIFSDTTERSPTFMLPPFRKHDDDASPNSWAFAKDPIRGTTQAWRHMLQRDPRGIDWTSELYREMSAPQNMIDDPPVLDLGEIASYHIGREHDQTRESGGYLLRIDVADDRSDQNRGAVTRAFDEMRSAYEYGSSTVCFGGTDPGEPGRTSRRSDAAFSLPLSLPATGMYLFYHLAFKLAFNAMSTATMGILGRIEGNYMVQVDATNKKLIDRATRIIRDLKKVDYQTACVALFTSLENYSQQARQDNMSHVLKAMDLIDRNQI